MISDIDLILSQLFCSTNMCWDPSRTSCWSTWWRGDPQFEFGVTPWPWKLENSRESHEGFSRSPYKAALNTIHWSACACKARLRCGGRQREDTGAGAADNGQVIRRPPTRVFGRRPREGSNWPERLKYSFVLFIKLKIEVRERNFLKWAPWNARTKSMTVSSSRCASGYAVRGTSGRKITWHPKADPAR